MALAPGTRLGPYEVVSLVGSGGMGEVYRATDTNLKRQVAIKVLPESLGADPDRLARFQREAEVLANLNHPNVAHIYGVEKSKSTFALVLELVEGQTLADRVTKGPIRLDEAVPIAKQIAEALEAAHERGIIHRDLKPANIAIAADGQVKVLDFGLAKLVDPVIDYSVPNVTASPTITTPAMLTGVGVILGTAAYMSPEQAKGRAADKRSDIWAFGCVLYEMLAGRRAFEGEDISDTLANVLKSEPDWTRIAAHNIAVNDLLRRCLRKEPRQRWQSAGDLRLLLDDTMSGSTRPEGATARRSRERLTWMSVTAALLALALVLGVTVVRRTPAPRSTIRFSIPPPNNAGLASSGGSALQRISPDGRRIAFVAQDADGGSLLWVRPLDALNAQALAGTDGAILPFWSADSRTIGFFAGSKLKKIGAGGGPVQSVCDLPNGSATGGTWNREGIILFGQNPGPIMRVADTGGMPTPATALDGSRQELSHRGPDFLPDGRRFLFQSWAMNENLPAMAVGSLDSSATQLLVGAERAASSYAPPGYLLFMREGTLMAQGFDSATQKVEPDASPIAENVEGGPTTPRSFSASLNNTLTYLSASGDSRRLVWFDRHGNRIEGREPQPAHYSSVFLSPDGTSVVTSTGAEGDGNIWLFDFQSGVRSRLTFETNQQDIAPVWSPDGARIMFASNRAGALHLYEKAANGGSGEEEVLAGSEPKFPTDWSRDGRFVLFTQGSTANPDLWVLPTAGDKRPIRLLATPFAEKHAHFSPDLRWIAYASNESGRYEVYVQPFPVTGAKRPISSEGGMFPVWNPNGDELFYLGNDGRLIAVQVKTTGATLDVGLPTVLGRVELPAGIMTSRFSLNEYAVSPDGQRFLFVVPSVVRTTASITVVTNWTASLTSK